MSRILALLLALWAAPVAAQSVQQSGNITPGHGAQWITNGVVGDSGAPAGGVSLVGSFVINDMLCASATSTTISIIDCGFSVTGTNNWVGLQNLNGGATAPTRAPGDSTSNVATTAFATGTMVNFLGTANTWTATQQFGPLPWVQALNYVAGSTGANLLSVRGSTASPITDGVATGIFQSVMNFAGITPSLYASTVKRSTNAAAYAIAAWGEASDPVGGTGSSVSGGRWTGSCNGGTNGNCTGATNVGLASVSYAYVIGAENQAWNSTGVDATTTFSAAKFATPMLSTCAGTNKCDAAFLANPNIVVPNAGVTPNINGISFPVGTVDSTGSVLIAGTTTTHGINLTSATCSTDCWLGPSGTSKIDGSGNISGLALTAGAASGILWTGRSAMSSPSDGIILLSNDAVTGFSRLQLGGTTSSFPAIKRNSTALNFRLADDSADAPITAGATTLSGQLVSTTGLPTIASGACGTTTNGAVVAGSTNQSGNITIGAAATTTCTISWSATLSVAPNACVFFPANAAAAATGTTVARTGAPSTTQVVLTGSALANANYSYICL